MLNTLMINIIHTYIYFNYKNTTNKFQFKIKIEVEFIWHIQNLETYLYILLTQNRHKIFYFEKIDLLMYTNKIIGEYVCII